jgi:hypothetical protein
MMQSKSEKIGKLDNGNDASRSHSLVRDDVYISRIERAGGRACKVEVGGRRKEFGADGVRAVMLSVGGGGWSTPVGGVLYWRGEMYTFCASEMSVRDREHTAQCSGMAMPAGRRGRAGWQGCRAVESTVVEVSNAGYTARKV